MRRRRTTAAASRDALLRILRIAPRFGAGDTPDGIPAAVCREALETFGADVALLVCLLDESHLTVEWREPASSLVPPGKTFLVDELPGLTNALRDVRTMFEPDLAERSSGEVQEVARQLGTRSAVRIPIAPQAQVGRMLVLQWMREIEEPDTETLVCFSRFADQAAVALERAERQRAQEEADRFAHQTQKLLDLSAALSAARTVEEVAAALCAEGRRGGVGADVVAAYLVEDTRIVRLDVGEMGHDRPSELPIDEILPLADAVRRGELVLVESAAMLDERYPLLRSLVPRTGYSASASIPLTAGAEVVGGVEFLFVEERRFGPADREFLAEISRGGGLALERARLLAEEHSIAVRLQRQLLPLRLPQVPGFRAAAEYRAGAAQMEVGGDWYDVVQLDQTRVALTVGDVVGKGVPAAGVMGRLRSALRALALTCADPTEVVEQLERFATTIEGAECTTLCYADLDLERGVLRYLHAGHLPMLLLDPVAPARYVADARRTPLCVTPPKAAHHAQLTLEPGTTVIFYSDGLVERRREPLSAGFERLQTLACSLAQLPPDQLAQALVESMTSDMPPTDDIVVLVVRFDGAPIPQLARAIRSHTP